MFNMNFQSSTAVPWNRFMYVKQDLLNDIQQRTQPKVLINPNFIRVKPHFNKEFLVNQTIHVNPNILKRNVQTEMKVIKPVPHKAIVTTPTKLLRVLPQVRSNVIVSTRMKLIREDQNSRIRRTSIHTKYKIIRHPSTVAKKETDIKKLYYVKNRFRIDHRSPVLKHRVSLNTRLTTKNVYVKYNSKLTQYVSINGILYKRSPKSLVNLNKKSTSSKKIVKRREQLLTIRGQKYKLDSNHRTLTLLSRTDKPNFKTIYVGGVTFKQKEPNVFVKTNTAHILLSQAKQRSINTLTNKMKKSNIPCLFYRKFGKCKGKENGNCIRIHNPDQVSLCSKFLQGACIDSKCLLSHKVSAEKMPTCKFFLEGLCSKDDCPYLHVKINAKADICKDFLEGFCKKAAECEKRHQYLCPDFEKIGKCAKRKCVYPHGNMVRKYKFSKTIASKLQATVGKVNKNHPVSCKTLKSDLKNCEPEKALNLRYYDESTSNRTKDTVKRNDIEIVDLDLEQNDLVSPKKRPTLGDLPSFIPFLDEEQNL